MTDIDYDLIVIGGGPGGYVAAIRASQLGMSVALVEDKHLGGICLNWGCIPTKALLRASEIRHMLDNVNEFGFTVSDIKMDINNITKRSRKVASQLSFGISHLLKKNKVQVFEGFGSLVKDTSNIKKIRIKTKDNNIEKTAKNVILATGARSRNLPFVSSDGVNIWDYKTAMTPPKLPASLIIVGSGAIGMEFASFYNDLGVDVTIVEALPSILPNEDTDISKIVKLNFEKRGIKIRTNSALKSVSSKENSVLAEIITNKKVETINSEKLILAIGIIANTEKLGLKDFNVKIDKGHVVTNEFLETDEKGVYAIGDITDGPWLAHKASHEGILCVEKIAGHQNLKPIDKTSIPGCTYCRPQVASIGMTETQARSKNINLKIGKFPFIGNGKAIALGDSEGLIKTIFNKDTGELIGAHMVGPEVTELIQGFSIAKKLETTEYELMHTIFPHPTLSEGIHESVLDAYNQAIHY
ncbi:MAG: dihydrolipoyl dehydrogenase [Alphaproteobacteria bacterium TMED199]|nr:MAG: dihydrolipoyl dehydrogenase [Alphaproteobacteria bacterium TMED199]